MLRDYIYTLDPDLINNIFKKFAINPSTAKNDRRLLNFQLLSPDSMMWRFLIRGSVYYLYSEDFVDGLDSVRSKILQTIPEGVELEFIAAREPDSFDEASPVTSADIYQSSDETEAMMDYAVADGYDFVFLCRSNEETVGDDAFETLYDN